MNSGKNQFFPETNQSFQIRTFVALLARKENTKLLEAESHELHLQLPLAGSQAAHDNAIGCGDLLIPGVHQIGERLEGVGSAESCIPVAGAYVDCGIDHDGLNELRNAHVFKNLPLVLIREVILVLHMPSRTE